MNRRNAAVLAILGCVSALPLRATLLFPALVKAETPPGSTTVSLPYFMNGATDLVFLKFKIPNFEQILSIEAFQVNFFVYDNNDGGMESGTFEFAQPGTNLWLDTFLVNLKPFTAGTPKQYSYSLCPCEIAQITPSIADGNFRLRISRESGDFFVAGGSAVMNVTLSPEPASALGVAPALAAFLFLVRRRRRRTSGNIV